jgi:gamma-D-glutamyl-L-lysine dipeptidyl-peptidase
VKNNFLNSPITNIRSKPLLNSEVISQILYGEKFKILSKKKNWIKIKTNFDNYIGYIKKSKYYENFKPTHKIYKIKSKVFKKVKNKFLPTKSYLFFASGVSSKNQYKNYIQFEKNKWIKKIDTKEINHYEKNFVKIFKLFLNSKYLWGGKTSNGIDCSALIQIYFYYNRIFFPRDTREQIKFCKKKFNKKFIKGDIIFWKGHIGLCINSSKFIHAYGPKKKVLIMPIKYTINVINKTASLMVKKISNIKNC